ncbi:MAG: thioredoxin family protein [Chloroflexi bacterium]|nr:thioredoxin family protein [Chloroflexota bacterium]
MTLNIKILGGGCANCERLEKYAKAAVAQLGVEATFTKSGDPAEYARYGILATPGLVINDKLVSAGRVPAVSQVVTLIANELAAA